MKQKNEKIVNAGGNFQKELPCFYFIFVILPRISAILANISRLILQFCAFLRISSPHFHLFSVVFINTCFRHPQSGATFQHLRRFNPCFVRGKLLLRSFSLHLQCNRKKNCAFSHLFSFNASFFAFSAPFFQKYVFVKNTVAIPLFHMKHFSFSVHRLIILVFGTHKPHYDIFFSFFACCAPPNVAFFT